MNFDNKKFELKADLGYPNPLEAFEVKKQESWGLMFSKAVSSEWFYNYGGKCKFYSQQDIIRERRIYARGLQSMTKFYDSLGTNGDLSKLNLSKKPITIVPKLCDIVVNGICNRGYVIKATAIDPISQKNKIEYRKSIERDRLGKDFAIKLKENFGTDVTTLPIDEIPETEQEQQLHLELEYKPSIEMSVELAIDAILNENNFYNILDRQLKKDLVEIGIACFKHRFCPDRGIILEYVDPENAGCSETTDPYFRDCFYHFEHKQVLISDLKVEFPWINDQPEILEQMLHSGEKWFEYHSVNQNQRIKGTTSVMYFSYKTTREKFKKIKEKATGEKLVSDADPFFKEDKVKKNDFKRVSKVEEVIFEGVHVLGTDIMLKWEVSENMARPNSNTQKVIDQFVWIAPNKEKNYFDSLVARMMTIDDLIQITELKAQQMIQRMMPDGYFIDEDALAEVDLGDGNVLKPQGLLDMFFQTGSIIGRTLGTSGEYNYAKVPVTELKTAGNLTKLQALRAERDSYRNDQREVIGLNKASDASTPEKDTLVGLQKLAALNTNIATRHILDASIELTKRMAEAIVYRTADIVQYFPELKQDLELKIGATSVADIDSLKELHLRDMAINLTLELDEEERAKLEADMSMAIEKNYLSLADKYKILSVKNFKQALSYMTILMDKHAKKLQKQKEEEFKYQSEANAQAAQVAEQARQQTAQMLGQIDMQKQQMVNEGLVQKEMVKGEQDRETLLLKIEGDTEIARINGGVAMEKLNELEKKKDEREKLRATQNSKMIKQREVNGEPIDFKEEEDFELEDMIND
jgi:hypothetical protein